MRGLTVYFQTLQLDNSIVRSNDKVRVNIITIPDNKKQSFIIELKRINQSNHFIRLNITEQTKKLLFILEKKNFFQNDPIIASKVITTKNIPNSPIDSKNMEVKMFNLYAPVASNKSESFKEQNRKIIGKMKIQFFLSTQFEPKIGKNPYNICKIHKGEGYSKVNGANNNENQSNSIFLDDCLTN